MLIRDKHYTIEEFEQFVVANPDRLLELINGRIVEKVVGRDHGRIVLKIGSRLIQWDEQNQIEGHYGTEVHHFVDDTIPFKPQPDVSFAYGGEEQPGGTVKGMPDFVVEVKSPGNTHDALREKARLYIQYGTRLVWLVFPLPRTVEVHHADGTIETFTAGQALSGGDVLPGFSMAVADMFK